MYFKLSFAINYDVGFLAKINFFFFHIPTFQINSFRMNVSCNRVV